MRRRLRDTLNLVPAQALLACLFMAAMTPSTARGQLAQYTPPGSVLDRPGDDKMALELRLEEALWKVGPFRLDPWIGLTNGAVVVNSFSQPTTETQERDVTLTAGAGVQGMVPFGAKTFLTFDAIPQYVFWLEQQERNQFNQWLGTRLFGFYNHLYLETGVSRRDSVQIRTAEADLEVDTRRDVADLIAELRLGETIHLFGGASYAEILSLEGAGSPIPDFSSQDRDETLLRGGVRYKPQPDSFIGLGLESSDVEFLEPESSRSNKGTSPLIQFRYAAPDFFVTGEIVLQNLEPAGDDSLFLPYDGTTGFFQLTWEPGWRLSYTPYYRKNLFYALSDDYSYFESPRYGLEATATLSERWTSRIYVEAGLDDYVALGPEVPSRNDDFTSVGIDFGVRISKLLELRFGYSIDEWNSNLDEFDRDNGRLRLQFSTGLELGGR